MSGQANIEAITNALIRLGRENNWEVDVLETDDGQLIIVDEITHEVRGTVGPNGEITIFEQSRDLRDYRLWGSNARTN